MRRSPSGIGNQREQAGGREGICICCGSRTYASSLVTNTPRSSLLNSPHSTPLHTRLSGGVHLGGRGVGEGATTRSQGSYICSTYVSQLESLSRSRTVLPCRPCRPMPPPPSSPNAPQQSQTRRSSTSRSRSKARPSPTSELPAGVGSLPPPMSSAWL